MKLDSGFLDIDAVNIKDEISNKMEKQQRFKNKLIIYTILTKEVGKPSDKYKDYFINMFYKYTDYFRYNTPNDKFSLMIKNEDAKLTSGGIDFYKGIANCHDKESLKLYINTYNESIPNLEDNINAGTVVEETKEIKDIDILVTEPAGIIMSSKDESSEWDMLKDHLNHNVWLEIHYEDNIRGNAEADVYYNANNKTFTVKSGALICKIPVKSLNNPDIDETKQEYLRNGNLIEYLNSQYKLTIDKEFKNMASLFSFVLGRESGMSNLYVKKQGKPLTLKTILLDCEKGNFNRYNRYIINQKVSINEH